ncbi:hypothetical protein D3C84_836020 [compost metagenome]
MFLDRSNQLGEGRRAVLERDFTQLFIPAVDNDCRVLFFVQVNANKDMLRLLLHCCKVTSILEGVQARA